MGRYGRGRGVALALLLALAAPAHAEPKNPWQWSCYWGFSDRYPLEEGTHIQIRTEICARNEWVSVIVEQRLFRKFWNEKKEWVEEDVEKWHVVDRRTYYYSTPEKNFTAADPKDKSAHVSSEAWAEYYDYGPR